MKTHRDTILQVTNIEFLAVLYVGEVLDSSDRLGVALNQLKGLDFNCADLLQKYDELWRGTMSPALEVDINLEGSDQQSSVLVHFSEFADASKELDEKEWVVFTPAMKGVK